LYIGLQYTRPVFFNEDFVYLIGSAFPASPSRQPLAGDAYFKAAGFVVLD
jgi:hypothetical protein